jgi:hypothetical protein
MSERLDPQMMALIRQDRALPGPHQGVKTRVLARVQTSFATSSTTVPPQRSDGVIAQRALSSAMRKAKLALTIAGVGVAATTAVMFAARPITFFGSSPGPSAIFGPPSDGSHTTSLPVPSARPIPSVTRPPRAPPPAATPMGTGRELHASKARAPQNMSLRVERKLLDRARMSLLHGDSAAALTVVAQHAARFPRGMLTEERDAIRVEALSAAGRQQDACTAAAAFHAAHPGSLLVAAVDGNCASDP